jgi:hypothetical protein
VMRASVVRVETRTVRSSVHDEGVQVLHSLR